jgi:tetraacyldisaccharide 4'-kinase
MREPPFWWRAAGVEACLLAPAAAIYGAVAASRLKREGYRVGVPVICIGNPTLGGAGKTPTALAVAHMLKAAGERPVFLSRGYGGRQRGPLLVAPDRDRAVDVGDEPLLLVRVAPTVVAHDRVEGAKAAFAAGASVIVMDDGFQNPSLAKDFSVLVIDGRRGLGNGKVFPAGPLRAPLDAQLARADAVVLVGTMGEAASVAAATAEARKLPLVQARLEPDRETIAALAGRRVLAFAGIGDPEKMFATLREAGIAVAATRSFADHHRYTPADARDLCRQADVEGLTLVTTEKDMARLQGEDAVAELIERVCVLSVVLVFAQEATLEKLLTDRIAVVRATRLRA